VGGGSVVPPDATIAIAIAIADARRGGSTPPPGYLKQRFELRLRAVATVQDLRFRDGVPSFDDTVVMGG
jgi:hypothetical protein